MKIVKIKELYLKILFVVTMFILAFCWSIFQPFNSAPDEHMKMQICNYVEHHNKLPHGGDSEIRNDSWGISYGFTPILSYTLSSGFIKIAKLFSLDGFSLVIAARLVNVLFFTGSIILIMAIAEKLFENKSYKWLFIVLTSCLPGFVFLGTYVNNDCLAIFSSALIIYSWIIGIKSEWNIKSCILLAIGLGLCALSYYNAYGLF